MRDALPKAKGPWTSVKAGTERLECLSMKCEGWLAGRRASRRMFGCCLRGDQLPSALGNERETTKAAGLVEWMSMTEGLANRPASDTRRWVFDGCLPREGSHETLHHRR